MSHLPARRHPSRPRLFWRNVEGDGEGWGWRHPCCPWAARKISLSTAPCGKPVKSSMWMPAYREVTRVCCCVEHIRYPDTMFSPDGALDGRSVLSAPPSFVFSRQSKIPLPRISRTKQHAPSPVQCYRSVPCLPIQTTPAYHGQRNLRIDVAPDAARPPFPSMLRQNMFGGAGKICRC